MPAEREVGVDAVLERSESQLLEPLDVDAGERLEREVGQRIAAPQRERLAQALGGALRRARHERAPSLLRQVLEAVEIELAEADAQDVAGGRVTSTPSSPPLCRNAERRRET